MRKHRRKHIETGEWVYGYLIGNDVIVGDIVEFTDEYFNTEFWYKVDPETVGQYTGKKDENGKEIYEGDRWKSYTDRIFLVEFSEGSAGFLPFVMDDGCGCCSDETRKNSEDGEVIGTRFDNPDLLGVEEA